LLERLGRREVSEIAGTTDHDRYPPRIARQLVEDDLFTIASGQPLVARAEVLFDRNGRLEWFSTTKYPVTEETKALGVAGITRRCGGGPRDFLLKTRLHAAAGELRHGSEAIIEIAAKYGFCDQSCLHPPVPTDPRHHSGALPLGVQLETPLGRVAGSHRRRRTFSQHSAGCCATSQIHGRNFPFHPFGSLPAERPRSEEVHAHLVLVEV